MNGKYGPAGRCKGQWTVQRVGVWDDKRDCGRVFDNRWVPAVACHPSER